MIKEIMLIVDLYSLLPAFTLASFLVILLWPENIAFRKRLRLMMIVLVNWLIASFVQMFALGTPDNMMVYIINIFVGFFGLVAVLASYQTKSTRHQAD